MPRHIKSRAGDKARAEAADAGARIEAFVGPATKRKSRPSAGARRQEHIVEVRDRIKRNDWDGLTPGKLVALYWVCHERVYDTTPVEIDKASTWTIVMKHAGTMVARHFDGEMDRAITFMRWVWTREREREQWRRSNGKQGRRITWQNQFVHDHLISDWRAAAARHHGG